MQTDSKGLGDGLGFCFSAMLPGNADGIHWSMDHTSEQQPAIYNVLLILELVVKMRSGKDIMT